MNKNLFIYTWVSEMFKTDSDEARIAEDDLKNLGLPYFKAHVPLKINGVTTSGCYFHGTYTHTWRNENKEGTSCIINDIPEVIFNFGFSIAYTNS